MAPLVFEDPIAVPILGAEYAEELQRAANRSHKPFSVALRGFLVARSRFAEDALARAVAQGITQYVLLGAGLDTFAYRNRYPGLRVFEVDHPATQQWKRELLHTNKIAVPDSLTFVTVDFEAQESLAAQLLAAGFDPMRPAQFSWLGVVPYLTLTAFRATVGYIAALPSSSGVVLDYGLPRHALPPLEQLAHDSLGARVALAGEPFQLFFTSTEIAAELKAFREIEDLGSAEINAHYFLRRTDHLKARGSSGRLLSARR